ncbi:TLR4 interactor with leucine rich repeats-like [Sycon ciliatum]|uniref:TLR4 interactor with leucine rich repeats-like n=1 Tax=Sycon ciliatum TaxID=27933 RepID=UPI0031F65900
MAFHWLRENNINSVVLSVEPFLIAVLASTRIGRTLDLSDNFIENIVPQHFQDIGGSVKTINLSMNLLATLPSNAFQFTTVLQTLDLNGNVLTIINASAFQVPSSTSTANLPIKSLHLNNNNLAVLSSNTFSALPNLVVIDLSGNFLTHIDDNTFSSSQYLNSLNLTNNRLTRLPYVSLNTSFLYADGNEITHLQGDMLSYVHNRKLRHISLRNNNITTIANSFFNHFKLL